MAETTAGTKINSNKSEETKGIMYIRCRIHYSKCNKRSDPKCQFEISFEQELQNNFFIYKIIKKIELIVLFGGI